MTAQEQSAACCEVAEAMYGPLILRWCWVDPECGGIQDIEDSFDILTLEDMANTEGACSSFKYPCYLHTYPNGRLDWRPVEDIFADTNEGGASAREKARNWIVRKGWYYTLQGTNGDDVIQVWLRKDDTCAPISVLAFDREDSTTIEEAEGWAITQAVRAMREGKDDDR